MKKRILSLFLALTLCLTLLPTSAFAEGGDVSILAVSSAAVTPVARAVESLYHPAVRPAKVVESIRPQVVRQKGAAARISPKKTRGRRSGA